MGAKAKVPDNLTRDRDDEYGDDNMPSLASASTAKQQTLLTSLVPSFPHPVDFVRRLVDVFGRHLIVYLFASQHLLKGFVMAMAGAPQSWILRQKQVAGPRMQVLTAVVSLPWAMKPIIGLVSDFFAIGGYNKAPYIIITSCFGVAAMCVVGFGNVEKLSIDILVLCFFLICMQCSTADLLSEAKYAEQIKKNPKDGPDLMSYVWFGLTFFGFLATCIVGPTMQYVSNQFPYVIALPAACFIIIPTMANYLQESKMTTEAMRDRRREMLQNKTSVVLVFCMLLGTFALTISGIMFDSSRLNAIVAVIVMIVEIAAFSILLNPMIAKVNAFFVVQTACAVSVSGGTFYFFTDDKKQYPEGPHFSKFFFTTVLGVIGAIVSMIGIATYQAWLKDWTYRRLLVLTNIVVSALSLLDLILFLRWNVKWGIPDHAFVIGSQVSQALVMQWMWMPGVIILSQLCPKGMEATMYALLAGCHNLGNAISANCGAYMLHLLGVSPSGAEAETHTFDRLWIASLIATILPMLTIFAIPWLIPDAKQTDTLLDDNAPDTATAGSLMEKWLGYDQTDNQTQAESTPLRDDLDDDRTELRPTRIGNSNQDARI